jgi:hypothetical protein
MSAGRPKPWVLGRIGAVIGDGQALKHKGSISEIVYRRLVPRLGRNKTIGAIAHRICQLIWMILNKGVRYEERGPAVSENSRRARIPE